MFVITNCRSGTETEIRYNGDKSKLSAEVFEKLDYQIKNFGEAPPDDWKKAEFRTVWVRNYQVKRNTSLQEAQNTFPRFTVVEEVYENEESAAKRLERIQEKPPDLQPEDREYWMVTGFRNQKNIYFIQTDSAMFSYYMDDFAGKLAEEIK
jgi:hypothetical protein